jgi:hypothetical protein
MKMLISTTEMSTPSSTLVLPALATGLGPNSDPDITTSWLYNYATGALSIAALTDAQLYQYTVKDSSGIKCGVIVSFGNSLTLPAWLNDSIDDRAPLTFTLAIMDTDIAYYTINDMARDTYPGSAHFGRLTDTMNDEFEKTF